MPPLASSLLGQTSTGDEGDEVPVNKKLSFNGKLNQYFHRVSKREAVRTTEEKTISDSVSSSETLKRRFEPEDTVGEGRITRSRPAMSRSITTQATVATAGITRSRSQTSLTPSSPSSRSASSASTRKKRSARSPRTTRSLSSPPSLLHDTIPPNLILLLVGVNPGILTGSTGYAYAHPSNLFWKLLHSSGITTIRHPPSDTYRLPELYDVGNTNIVERPTRDASMLSKAEMNAGVPVLEAKVAAQRPEAVCLVGKSIWEAVWRVRKGRAIKKEEFRYGWQDESENMGRVAGGDGVEGWDGAPVFVATTTSGLAAGMTMAEKQAVWNELGTWVVKRREERKASPSAAVGESIDATTSTDVVEVAEDSTSTTATAVTETAVS